MIDFTKPIRNSQTEEIVNILYRDEMGIYFEYKNSDFVRMHCSIDEFNKMFENVSEEPRKIKGFIGLSTSKETGTVYCTSVVYESKEKLLKCCGGYTTIIEINVSEGEGLQ
jgi:hypothetical protein